MVYHNTYYLSKLVQTLSEGYNHILLKEAVPYSVVKDYLKIERSPEAETVIKKVFSNLKSLPNATQLDKRGYRIGIPYGEQSVEQEIDTVLSKYDFKVKDFEKGIATDTKSNREIKLGKALNIVSKKEPKAKELLDLFSSAKSKGVQSQDEGLMLVFSNHPYDIAGMTSGRSWPSCMNLITGSNKRYVSLDIEKGTIICYLAKSTDKDLKNPIGRVLIKPFLNVENEQDVILYPEEKTYGSIDNPEKLISTIDDIMEKTQKISGAYNKMGCLYSDSDRKSIIDKEWAIKLVQKAIKDKDFIEDNIFKQLPKNLKNEYLSMAIESEHSLSTLQYQYTSYEQKQLYIDKIIEKEDSLLDSQYKITPDSLKKLYIEKMIKAGYGLSNQQYEDASDNLKQLYIEKRVEQDFSLSNPQYKITPDSLKKLYIEKRVEKGLYLSEQQYQDAPDNIKKLYIEKRVKAGRELTETQYQDASDEQKQLYIEIRVEVGYKITDQQYQDASDSVKKLYIEKMIKAGDILSTQQYQDSSDEQKQLYIEKMIRAGFDLSNSQYKVTPDNLKQFYIEKMIKIVYSLSDQEYEDASDNLKQLYIEKRNAAYGLSDQQYKVTPDNLKQIYIEKRAEADYGLSDQQYKVTPDNLKQYYFELLKKNNILIYSFFDYYDDYQNWLEKNK